jgi:hypothetical protein
MDGARPGQRETRAEQHEAAQEWPCRAVAVSQPAGLHDAYHVAQHEGAEDPAIQVQAAEIAGDKRHDRHYR